MQQIIFCILNGGRAPKNVAEFFERSPFLEMTGSECISSVQRPFAIKTHLNAELNPWSPDAKYIIVMRNPKDTLVSFYHHTKSLPGYRFKNGSFDTFFNLFINGKCDFGNYYDFILSWWKKRHHNNVILITYEEMRADAEESIKKVASFIGKEYIDKINSDGVYFDQILKYSSINHMKSMNDDIKDLFNCPIDAVPIDKKCGHLMFSVFGSNRDSVEFVRRGIVGDHKITLSAEQDKILSDMFIERTRGTGIETLWKDLSWL